jgi:hypothetical protein
MKTLMIVGLLFSLSLTVCANDSVSFDPNGIQEKQSYSDQTLEEIAHNDYLQNKAVSKLIIKTNSIVEELQALKKINSSFYLVSTSSINVREEPTTKSEIIAYLRKASLVQVKRFVTTQSGHKWAELKNRGGYISAGLISPLYPEISGSDK